MPRTHTSAAFQSVTLRSAVSAISYSASLRPASSASSTTLAINTQLDDTGPNPLARKMAVRCKHDGIISAITTISDRPTDGPLDVFGGLRSLSSHLTGLSAKRIDVIILSSTLNATAPVDLTDPTVLARPTQDLVDTVAAAFASGWRQVKLYFMCGLPTETDEDVLQIATLAKRVIETGRRVSGHRDIRCTVSIGGFVPKPHTPFQWAAQLDHETTDARLLKLRDAIRADKQYGKAIGFRYHDGKPGTVEGLLSRGDRRVGAVIEQVWRDGGRFDGWSEHFSFDRWMSAADTAFAGTPVDVAWFTTRERDQTEVLPWDHLDSGLDKDWLWEDWQDALSGVEVEDCRWSPCFDCGVCEQMGTEIQVGPSGTTLLGMPTLPVRGDGLVAAGTPAEGS